MWFDLHYTFTKVKGMVIKMEDKKVKRMEDIIERYRKLYSGLIYDTLAEMGYPNQACNYDIRPIRHDMVLAGTAFTIKGKATDEKIEETGLMNKLLAMIKKMYDGCIVVIDTGTDTRCAHFGELFGNTSRAHGALGALVDGGIRDSGFLLDMNYNVFTRYQNAVELQGRFEFEHCQKPVKIRGTLTDFITVNPGDFIFGDLDSVLVIPKEIILKVLEKAEGYEKLEKKARKDFGEGIDPLEVYKKHGII